jgi:hypothetical protein
MSEKNTSDNWKSIFKSTIDDLGHFSSKLPPHVGKTIGVVDTIINIEEDNSTSNIPQWKVKVANLAAGTASGIVAGAGVSATVAATVAAGGATPAGVIVFYQGSYAVFKATDSTHAIVKDYTMDYLMSEGFVKREESIKKVIEDLRDVLGDNLYKAGDFLKDLFDKFEDYNPPGGSNPPSPGLPTPQPKPEPGLPTPEPKPTPEPNPGIIDPIDNMGDAEQAQMRRYDPLTFDMDGDGIDLISLEDSNAFFAPYPQSLLGRLNYLISNWSFYPIFKQILLVNRTESIYCKNLLKSKINILSYNLKSLAKIMGFGEGMQEKVVI